MKIHSKYTLFTARHFSLFLASSFSVRCLCFFLLLVYSRSCRLISLKLPSSTVCTGGCNVTIFILSSHFVLIHTTQRSAYTHHMLVSSNKFIFMFVYNIFHVVHKRRHTEAIVIFIALQANRTMYVWFAMQESSKENPNKW